MSKLGPEFDRLLDEIRARPFSASDIGWNCSTAEPGTDPRSLFVDPLFRFHPEDSRVACLGFIEGRLVLHHLWWSDVQDVRLLDEIARILVKPGYAAENAPRIDRKITMGMRPGPVGLLDGRTIDWIWIVLLLDWISEQEFDGFGLRYAQEVSPDAEGILRPVDHGRSSIFTEKLFRVIRQIDFQAILDHVDEEESHAEEPDYSKYSDPLSVKMIAVKLNVNVSTIHRWIRNDKLNVIKAGSLGYRVLLSDLKKFGRL